MRVRRHKNYIDKPFDELAPCGTPSPDLSLTCTRELGHLGWCTHTPSDTSWFLDNWAIDEYADTAEAAVDPEPTMSAEEWNRLHKQKPKAADTVHQPQKRQRKFTRPRKTEIAVIPHKSFQVTAYRVKLAEAKLSGHHHIIYPALTAGSK